MKQALLTLLRHMAAQMMTAINRLCCTFACKTYQIGPKKRVGIFLTCTGSEPEEMKRRDETKPYFVVLDAKGIERSVVCEKRA